jgi:hypothetical protein
VTVSTADGSNAATRAHAKGEAAASIIWTVKGNPPPWKHNCGSA